MSDTAAPVINKNEMDIIKDFAAKSSGESSVKHHFNNGVITVDPVVATPDPVNPPVVNPEPVAVTPPAEPVVESKKIEEPIAKVEIPVAEPVKVEAPKVDTSVAVEPNKEITPEIPIAESPKVEVDYNKILEEISNGSIKTKEDFSNVIEEYNKQKELLASDTYQYAAKLSAWEKEGLPTELFSPIQDLTPEDIGEMPVDELAKLDIKFKHPTWSEEDINLYFNEEYKQDAEKHDENTRKFGSLRMRESADNFRGRLGELKELSYVPTNESRVAEAQKSENLRKETWKSNMPKLMDEFSKVTVSTDDKGGVMDFVPTKEQKDELRRDMEQIVTSAPVKFDEQGIKAAKAIMLEKFLSKNVNQISKAIAQKVASNKDAEYLKKITNPTGAQPESVAPTPVKKERTAQDAFADIAKNEGIILRK